jgi:hypothetical protein
MQASFIGDLVTSPVAVSRSLRSPIDPRLTQITTKLVATDWMRGGGASVASVPVKAPSTQVKVRKG